MTRAAVRDDGEWAEMVAARACGALAPLADPDRAAQAFEYMKGVAPFLGVNATDRRHALRSAWVHLSEPTSTDLGRAASTLMAMREREYHYAAYGLIDRYRRNADARFLRVFGTNLLTTNPWWDTVDGLVNAMVSPLMLRFHDDGLVDEWSGSGDRWLVRAAIGHQRGWKTATDTPRVLSLCDAHWPESEFFVAKAIGWALRDLARIDHAAVASFLDSHDSTNRVAIREAQRGLARSRQVRTH